MALILWEICVLSFAQGVGNKTFFTPYSHNNEVDEQHHMGYYSSNSVKLLCPTELPGL